MSVYTRTLPSKIRRGGGKRILESNGSKQADNLSLCTPYTYSAYLTHRARRELGVCARVNYLPWVDSRRGLLLLLHLLLLRLHAIAPCPGTHKAPVKLPVRCAAYTCITYMYRRVRKRLSEISTLTHWYRSLGTTNPKPNLFPPPCYNATLGRGYVYGITIPWGTERSLTGGIGAAKSDEAGLELAQQLLLGGRHGELPRETGKPPRPCRIDPSLPVR
jgi:hypothetical protein